MSDIPIFNIDKIHKNSRLRAKIHLARLRSIARNNQLYLIPPFKPQTIDTESYYMVTVGMNLLHDEFISSINRVEITAPKNISPNELQKKFFLNKPLRHQLGLFFLDNFSVEDIRNIAIPSHYKISWDLYGNNDYEWILIATSTEDNINIEVAGNVES